MDKMKCKCGSTYLVEYRDVDGDYIAKCDDCGNEYIIVYENEGGEDE